MRKKDPRIWAHLNAPPHGFLRKDVSETKNLFEGILGVFLRGSSFSSQSLGFASEVLSTGYLV